MRPFGAKLAQWFRSYKHFSKKVKFPEQDHIPQLKKKNEFFTYFEGPEGVQKVITLYNINQGNYTELVNQKKKFKIFFYPLYVKWCQCQSSYICLLFFKEEQIIFLQ